MLTGKDFLKNYHYIKQNLNIIKKGEDKNYKYDDLLVLQNHCRNFINRYEKLRDWNKDIANKLFLLYSQVLYKMKELNL